MILEEIQENGRWNCGLVSEASRTLLYPRTYPQYLTLILIKDVRSKAPVCTEHLSRNCFANAMVLFRQETNMIPSRVHQYVFIGLLEAHQDIHHLQLSLHDNRRVGQYASRWVVWSEDAMPIFWYVYWGEELVRVFGGSCLKCICDLVWWSSLGSFAWTFTGRRL